MLPCNSGKVYLDEKQAVQLLKFLEDVPPYKAEYHHKKSTIVALGYSLPIGVITPETRIIEYLDDQTHNYHTPYATNNLGYALIWYTIDTGTGPKHGSALSPEWFKLIEGAKVKIVKKKPAKMTPQASAFFERMKAEHKGRETEKTKPTVTEPAKDDDKSPDKSSEDKNKDKDKK